MYRLTGALALAMLLAACGQKGDLHLPDDDDDTAMDATPVTAPHGPQEPA
ncbi:lipoprotein [Aquisalimonas sp.]|nr:lipoprotein [Aquisalimonas sp.]